jgi:hypothetical protein
LGFALVYALVCVSADDEEHVWDLGLVLVLVAMSVYVLVGV